MIYKTITAAILILAATAAIGQKASVATATLQTPTDIRDRIVANDALWRCSAATCSGAASGGKFGDRRACRELAHKVGTVAAFTSPRGALSPEELIACNARARSTS